MHILFHAFPATYFTITTFFFCDNLIIPFTIPTRPLSSAYACSCMGSSSERVDELPSEGGAEPQAHPSRSAAESSRDPVHRTATSALYPALL